MDEAQIVETELAKLTAEIKIAPVENFTESKIAFFCRDCSEIVEVEKIKNLRFRCKKCGGENIALGTEKSVKNYFHLK